MIKKLNFLDWQTLSVSHLLQREAYEIEATLIGSRNIPPLQESIEKLKNAEETFLGYFNESHLVGFIAVEEEAPHLRISRLVVSPRHFKKGIGKALVQYVLDNKPKEQIVIVSTGEANYPARHLYEKLEFTLRRIFNAEGISILEFIREGNRDK